MVDNQKTESLKNMLELLNKTLKERMKKEKNENLPIKSGNFEMSQEEYMKIMARMVKSSGHKLPHIFVLPPFEVGEKCVSPGMVIPVEEIDNFSSVIKSFKRE
jgi:hypothetical protein